MTRMKWREGLRRIEILCVREKEGGNLLHLSSYVQKSASAGEKEVGGERREQESVHARRCKRAREERKNVASLPPPLTHARARE